MSTSREARERLIVARTPRLTLREKHLDDAPEDYAWRRDPEIARYDGREPLTQPYSEFVARLEHDLRFGNPRERMYAIDTIEGEHIGNVMYYNASVARDEAEVGITIGPASYRSRGYGREALVAFMRFLFETTPFRRIVLHALSWNERAIRSFEAAGFVHVGLVERQGTQLVRMEAAREWWMLHDMEGRFNFGLPRQEGQHG